MDFDIVSFLQTRFDEDATLARRCGDDDCGQWVANSGTVDFCQSDLTGFHPTIPEHVARHDPERVLREVAAKQRTLDRHSLSPTTNDPELPWDSRNDCQYDGKDWPCPDLLDLALPYADHPRPDWQPTH